MGPRNCRVSGSGHSPCRARQLVRPFSPKKRAFSLGLFRFTTSTRPDRVRVRSGQTCPQNAPFEHRKLAEQLAPRPRPPHVEPVGPLSPPNRTAVALPEPPTPPRRAAPARPPRPRRRVPSHGNSSSPLRSCAAVVLAKPAIRTGFQRVRNRLAGPETAGSAAGSPERRLLVRRTGIGAGWRTPLRFQPLG